MTLTTELFPYQREDVARAVERGRMLVAYEMGLGKTIMAIAALESLFAENKITRTVIIVPSNLKWQWANAIATHTDAPTGYRKVKGLTVPADSRCTVVDGNKHKREADYAYIEETTPRYIILSYEQVVNDWEYVKRLKPGAIVLDEATYIKTFSAARTKAVKKFTARYRFALSGQPVESKPEELFSIMQWVDSGVLGGYSTFDERYIVRDFFGGVKRYQNLDELHDRLSGAMIRKTRRDPDVAPYLPDVQEEDILIPLDPAGRRLYKRIVGDFLAALLEPGAQKAFDEHAHYNGGEDSDGGGRAAACYAALLALCSHPDVLVKSAQDYARSEQLRAAGVKQDLPGSRYAYDLWQSDALDDVVKTPKLDAAVAEVELILGTHPNNKVIIFSRYRWVIAALSGLFEDIAVAYHGGLTSTQKALAVNKFRTDSATRIFLSTEAGTYGVDLPEATHLINFDPPGNAGRRGQRNARHVRAGSKHEKVFVINLLIDGSIEVRKLLLTELREQLAAAIMDGSHAHLDNSIPGVTEWVTTHPV